jgi:ribosomal protein S18 acetylase RimI-like enzyme
VEKTFHRACLWNEQEVIYTIAISTKMSLMCMVSMNQPSALPPDISFRPICDEDLPFLSRLYASTRQKELAVTSWTQAQKEQFLQQQFDAQHRFYQEHFSKATFDIIQMKEKPIGRWYVLRRTDEIRIIDITLMPENRGHGLGSALLELLKTEAAGVPCPIRIHVETVNPALRLYERLGFRKTEDQGVYWLMEWPGENESSSRR